MMNKALCQTPSSSEEAIALKVFVNKLSGRVVNCKLAKKPNIAIKGLLPLTKDKTEFKTLVSNVN